MIYIYFFGFLVFVILFTREVIAPASGASCDKRWRIYAGALNSLNIIAVLAAGFVYSHWIESNSLLNISGSMPVIFSSFIIFIGASFIGYWWHRLMHYSDTIWRMVHQLHHSPSRVETLTSFYLHPLDSFFASLLNASVAYLIFGASPLDAAIALFYVIVFNLIAHSDLKTPWALGFFLQRPEMHRIHHENGVHENNYGLPIFDLLFGTWRNPQNETIQCGFDKDKEYRLKDMLLMKDVHKG